MKRLVRNSVTASTDVLYEPVFTPNELVAFLQEIDELQNLDIAIKDNPDGSFELTVGSKFYVITKPKNFYG
ncbi:MAG: hypothetical protein ACLUFN_03845 [Eubacterium sp.]